MARQQTPTFGEAPPSFFEWGKPPTTGPKTTAAPPWGFVAFEPLPGAPRASPPRPSAGPAKQQAIPAFSRVPVKRPAGPTAGPALPSAPPPTVIAPASDIPKPFEFFLAPAKRPAEAPTAGRGLPLGPAPTAVTRPPQASVAARPVPASVAAVGEGDIDKTLSDITSWLDRSSRRRTRRRVLEEEIYRDVEGLLARTISDADKEELKKTKEELKRCREQKSAAVESGADLKRIEQERDIAAKKQIEELGRTGQVRILARERPLFSGEVKGNIDEIKKAFRIGAPDRPFEYFADEQYRGRDANKEFYDQFRFAEQLGLILTRPQNMIIMMYGSSGSGKTFTANDLLLRIIQELQSQSLATLELCFLDVYKGSKITRRGAELKIETAEGVYDLLKNRDEVERRLAAAGIPNGTPYGKLTKRQTEAVNDIRERVLKIQVGGAIADPKIWISDRRTCRNIKTMSKDDLKDIQRYIQQLRVTLPTKANPDGSSRSHLFIHIRLKVPGSTRARDFFLIDLAGSEDYTNYGPTEYRRDIQEARKKEGKEGKTRTEEVDFFDLQQLKTESAYINASLATIPCIIYDAQPPTEIKEVKENKKREKCKEEKKARTIRKRSKGLTADQCEKEEPFECLLREIIQPNTFLTIIGTVRPDGGPLVSSLPDWVKELDPQTRKAIGQHQYDIDTANTFLFLQNIGTVALGGGST